MFSWIGFWALASSYYDPLFARLQGNWVSTYCQINAQIRQDTLYLDKSCQDDPIKYHFEIRAKADQPTQDWIPGVSRFYDQGQIREDGHFYFINAPIQLIFDDAFDLTWVSATASNLSDGQKLVTTQIQFKRKP